MAFASGRRDSVTAYDHRPLPSNALPQRVIGGATVAIVAALCVSTAWTAWDSGGCADLVEVTGTRGDKLDVVIARGDKGDVIASRGEGLRGDRLRGDKLAVSKPSLSNVYATLFDPRFALDVPSGFVSDTPVEQVALASSAPPPAASSARNDRAAKSATAPRPNLAPIRTAAARDDGQNQPAADRPTMLQSIFAKLFGKPAPVTLAYAATDDAGLSTSKNIVGRYDRYTAVYDISAHTVYMPDGSQLEAHSGLGDRLDDPRHADERMHGVTPPNIYGLRLREAPFHGVRALRMIPEDEDKTFGRAGLLAHTYMLGPNGDSNGCVSFKNYDAFLQAYLRNDVKRLAVVTHLE
jgi:hypothetical protein